MPVGDSFREGSRDWKGARVALYSYSAAEQQGGAAYFDDFVYTFDGASRSFFLDGMLQE